MRFRWARSRASLHRYASDAFVLVTLLHLAREWMLGRYAHFRRFSWLTGVLALWLVFASGIGGFWLVWDRLAQYSLIATTEWLDALPVFDGALIRNFIALGRGQRPAVLAAHLPAHRDPARAARDDVGAPAAALAPGDQPAAGARVGHARRAHGAVARLARRERRARRPRDRPGALALDWFYLGVHAFADATSPLALWLASAASRWLLVALPWISRAARTPRPAAAVVDLANCNGCARCFADCPYAAVTMQPRTDGRPLPRQAVVDPDLCAGCGICAGACPSSTPFRSVAELVTGIDMPQSPVDALRGELEAALARLAAPAAPERRRSSSSAVTRSTAARTWRGSPTRAPRRSRMLCAAQLPPSFVEYALRAGADGVLVTGCRDGDCTYRLGNRWTAERLAGAARAAPAGGGSA